MRANEEREKEKSNEDKMTAEASSSLLPLSLSVSSALRVGGMETGQKPFFGRMAAGVGRA